MGSEAQEDMLRVIGFSTMEELINATVPQSIIARGKLKLPEAASESQALQELKDIATKNEVRNRSTPKPRSQHWWTQAMIYCSHAES